MTADTALVKPESVSFVTSQLTSEWNKCASSVCWCEVTICFHGSATQLNTVIVQRCTEASGESIGSVM